MPVGLTDVSQSPAFYAALVKTPDVLGRLVDTAFGTSTDSTPRSLSEIWAVSSRDPMRRREKVLSLLQDAVSSNVGLKIDLISVTVKTRDPLLSCRRASPQACSFKSTGSQRGNSAKSRASAERKFTESRMAPKMQSELHAAEDDLQAILPGQPTARAYAALEIEKARISRKIDVIQTTYMTLAAAFERARIDEVRDTPLITIVQRPEAPSQPDARGLPSKTLLMFVLGFFAACAVALARQSITSMRQSQDDMALGV